MSDANMAQHSAEQPLSQLTLNKWFSYQKGVFAPLNTIPSRERGLFSIAFAGDFSMAHINSMIEFFATHQQNVTAMCQYQPDLGSAFICCGFSPQPTKPNANAILAAVIVIFFIRIPYIN